MCLISPVHIYAIVFERIGYLLYFIYAKREASIIYSQTVTHGSQKLYVGSYSGRLNLDLQESHSARWIKQQAEYGKLREGEVNRLNRVGLPV